MRIKKILDPHFSKIQMNYRRAFLMIVTLGWVNPCLCQVPQQKQVSADPVLRDRTKLSLELIQLRDSINSELEFITLRVDTSIVKQRYIERAKKKLKIEKNEVEEAIKNVLNATQDTWDYFVREMANNTVIQIGYEYHQVKKELFKSISQNRQNGWRKG